ncbi:MAG: queuosine precursor transporter [Lentisphaeria bacterium]|nr:queuosine precursor transporter [Lentisphaeria bacterium]
MNTSLWFLMLAVNFTAILLLYRFAGKTGLYVWIPISTIVANIQVLKTVELFGVTATLGNIVYASSFLVTDILSENYGKKEAARAVAIGFFSLIAMAALMNLALWFEPAESDFAQDSLKTIFGIMPRIAAASLTAYVLSQTHDVYAFHFWKKQKPGIRYLWVRNNASTMVSQLIDTTVFCVIAFTGVFPWPVFWQIFWTTYMLKWLVAAADTPFVYWAKVMFSRKAVREDI